MVASSKVRSKHAKDLSSWDVANAVRGASVGTYGVVLTLMLLALK